MSSVSPSSSASRVVPALPTEVGWLDVPELIGRVITLKQIDPSVDVNAVLKDAFLAYTNYLSVTGVGSVDNSDTGVSARGRRVRHEFGGGSSVSSASGSSRMSGTGFCYAAALRSASKKKWLAHLGPSPSFFSLLGLPSEDVVSNDGLDAIKVEFDGRDAHVARDGASLLDILLSQVKTARPAFGSAYTLWHRLSEAGDPRVRSHVSPTVSLAGVSFDTARNDVMAMLSAQQRRAAVVVDLRTPHCQVKQEGGGVEFLFGSPMSGVVKAEENEMVTLGFPLFDGAYAIEIDPLDFRYVAGLELDRPVWGVVDSQTRLLVKLAKSTVRIAGLPLSGTGFRYLALVKPSLREAVCDLLGSNASVADLARFDVDVFRGSDLLDFTVVVENGELRLSYGVSGFSFVSVFRTIVALNGQDRRSIGRYGELIVGMEGFFSRCMLVV